MKMFYLTVLSQIDPTVCPLVPAGSWAFALYALYKGLP